MVGMCQREPGQKQGVHRSECLLEHVGEAPSSKPSAYCSSRKGCQTGVAEKRGAGPTIFTLPRRCCLSLTAHTETSIPQRLSCVSSSCAVSSSGAYPPGTRPRSARFRIVVALISRPEALVGGDRRQRVLLPLPRKMGLARPLPPRDPGVLPHGHGSESKASVAAGSNLCHTADRANSGENEWRPEHAALRVLTA
jgi:hypothetical protein